MVAKGVGGRGTVSKTTKETVVMAAEVLGRPWLRRLGARFRALSSLRHKKEKERWIQFFRSEPALISYENKMMNHSPKVGLWMYIYIRYPYTLLLLNIDNAGER